MDIFKIGGRAYNVSVMSIKETFNILYDENTGRTMEEGNPMILSPLGTFIGHNIVVRPKKGYESEFDELFDFVAKPRKKGVQVDAVHNQTTIGYEAYVSNGEREVTKIDAATWRVYWGELSLNIVPIRATYVPAEDDDE